MQPGPVVTPEAVPLEFEVAGLGSRFFALAIDWTVQAVALVAVVLAGTALGRVTGGDHGLGLALLYLVLFLALFAYPVALETLWRGRTIGKAVMGLRVVTTEGGPVRFRHAAVRAALGLVDFLVTFGSAAVLASLLSRNSQRLGDMVAGTLVLRERTGMRAPVPVAFAVPAALDPFVASLDVAGLPADMYAAVRAFLLRAATLPPPVRARLAVELAGPVRARLQVVPPEGVGPELFLLSVAVAHQRRAAPASASPFTAATTVAPVPTPPPATGDFVPPS